MSPYYTHKTGSAGKRLTLERKAARRGKYAPLPATAHVALQVDTWTL